VAETDAGTAGAVAASQPATVGHAATLHALVHGAAGRQDRRGDTLGQYPAERAYSVRDDRTAQRTVCTAAARRAECAGRG